MNYNVGGQPFSRNNPSEYFKTGPIKSILSSTGPKNIKRSVMLNTPSKSGMNFNLSPMKSTSQSRLNKETFSS